MGEKIYTSPKTGEKIHVWKFREEMAEMGFSRSFYDIRIKKTFIFISNKLRDYLMKTVIKQRKSVNDVIIDLIRFKIEHQKQNNV